MEINYEIVVLGALMSIGVGFVWFGPLFGKKWMEIVGATDLGREQREAMQKAAGPLYGIQFALTLLQLYILVHFVKGWSGVSGIESSLWIWLGFVMPTVAAGAMWNTNPPRVKWAMFLIQSSYYLVLFGIFGYLLGRWG